MNRRRFLCRTSATTLAVMALAACGDKASTAAPAPAAQKPAPKDAYEMAGRASGFTVGSMMAANTVYVFFDPTCPHCATLWGNAKPLASKLKLVWIPIGWLQKSSAPQAATILSATDPAAAMAENEASVLERKGGITVAASLPDEVVAKVKANTDLFNKIGEESVPLIVFKNGKTGQYGVHAGVVPAEQLAAMVGV
jgi:thiol:disulfide interchange protein DsbG